MGLLFAAENSAFLWAITLMLIIAIFEGVAMVLGAGISQFLDNLLPDVDIDVSEVDMNSTPGALSLLLGWFYLGKVPALIWLILMLTSFGVSGYAIQGVSQSVTGIYLPGLMSVPAALFCSVLFIRLSGKAFSKLRLQDETEAVSTDTFIGSLATIVIGEARKGLAAEARLTDKFGTTHYIRVEPDNEAETFSAGEEVLLVSQAGSKFNAIKPHNQNLTDS